MVSKAHHQPEIFYKIKTGEKLSKKAKDLSANSVMPAEQVKCAGNVPRKITVSISKGGVGKTTTAVNLAMGLSLAGFDVLLVDADVQGQATYMLGADQNTGVAELISGEAAAEDAIKQVRDNLWLLSGGKSLAAVKREIEKQSFGGEMTLAEKLNKIDNNFDYVIADTPPGWDVLSVNFFFYATEILSPVSLEVMSLQGLSSFYKSIKSINKFRPEISVKYIVPTFFDKDNKNSMEILGKLNKLYGKSVCGPIRYHESLAESPGVGKTIFEFAPGSIGTNDYRSLVRRVAGDDNLFKD